MERSVDRACEVPAVPRRTPRIGAWTILVAALAILGPAGWVLFVEWAVWPLVAVWPWAPVGALAGSAACQVLGLTAAHAQARAAVCVISALLFGAAQFPVYALLFRRWRRGGRWRAVGGVLALHLALAVPWLAVLAVGRALEG